MSEYVRYKGKYWICHAYVHGDYEAQSYFDREKTKAFLDKLASQEPFKYEIPDDFEPAIAGIRNPKSYVKIQLKSYDYSYLVMMGTLIKGLNEHRAWAYEAMMSNKPYFPEAEKIMGKMLKTNKTSPMNMIGGHNYIIPMYDFDTNTYTTKPMKYKRRTIRGMFRLHTKLGPLQRGEWKQGADGRSMGIWASYMGAPAE